MKLHRHPGISYNAAWRMRHKLMQGMMERDREYTLAGQVQLDDAYLGGERSAGKRGRGAPGKTHSGIKSSSTRDGRSGGLLRSCARLAFAWESSASGPIGGHVALPGRPHRTAHPRRPRKRYTALHAAARRRRAVAARAHRGDCSRARIPARRVGPENTTVRSGESAQKDFWRVRPHRCSPVRFSTWGESAQKDFWRVRPLRPRRARASSTGAAQPAAHTSPGPTRKYGSSPRGRGTPMGPSRESGYGRFIPAWAGNTAATGRARGATTVHPRVGGEHPAHSSLRHGGILVWCARAALLAGGR